MQEQNKLEYPYDDHPAPGTTVEIAPGVRWLTMPMPGSLSHINLYLLEDKDGWFVVDTGLALPDVSEWWREIFRAELGRKPIIGVICTHMHPDHIGQAAMICDEYRCALDMPTGYERLVDGQILTIGQHDWRVVVGSGHSPEHVCLYCAALKIMISGDQILPIITSNVSVHPTEPNANPLKDWMESHDRFLATPADTLVLPAHNLPFYGVRERLRGLISHHDDRMLAIEEACVEPQMAKDLLPVLFARELDARQMMMALGEAIAHLHLLMHRNRIDRTLHEDGRYRFLSIDPDLTRRAHPGAHDAPSDGPVMV